MLDKDSILGALNVAKSESSKFTHESAGKTDLLDKLIKAINIGTFDAKVEESKNDEIALPV